MRKMLLVAVLLTVAIATGQVATDANYGARLSVDQTTNPKSYNFTWWGKTGCHYIVETSTDLMGDWAFFKDHNPSGSNSAIGISHTSNEPRLFFRVTEFDPKNVPPDVDSDGDGMPDKWEMYYFDSLSRDGNGDWNSDGLSDRDAFVFGLNPKAAVVTGNSYQYTANDELVGYIPLGGTGANYGPDAEGNLTP